MIDTQVETRLAFSGSHSFVSHYLCYNEDEVNPDFYGHQGTITSLAINDGVYCVSGEEEADQYTNGNDFRNFERGLLNGRQKREIDRTEQTTSNVETPTGMISILARVLIVAI